MRAISFRWAHEAGEEGFSKVICVRETSRAMERLLQQDLEDLQSDTDARTARDGDKTDALATAAPLVR